MLWPNRSRQWTGHCLGFRTLGHCLGPGVPSLGPWFAVGRRPVSRDPGQGTGQAISPWIPMDPHGTCTSHGPCNAQLLNFDSAKLVGAKICAPKMDAVSPLSLLRDGFPGRVTTAVGRVEWSLRQTVGSQSVSPLSNLHGLDEVLMTSISQPGNVRLAPYWFPADPLFGLGFELLRVPRLTNSLLFKIRVGKLDWVNSSFNVLFLCFPPSLLSHFSFFIKTIGVPVKMSKDVRKWSKLHLSSLGISQMLVNVPENDGAKGKSTCCQQTCQPIVLYEPNTRKPS